MPTPFVHDAQDLDGIRRHVTQDQVAIDVMASDVAIQFVLEPTQLRKAEQPPHGGFKGRTMEVESITASGIGGVVQNVAKIGFGQCRNDGPTA